MKKTRKAYEEYLNELSPPYESDEWIIKGTLSKVYRYRKQYGTAIRKHDIIGFNAGYTEWSKQ